MALKNSGLPKFADAHSLKTDYAIKWRLQAGKASEEHLEHWKKKARSEEKYSMLGLDICLRAIGTSVSCERCHRKVYLPFFTVEHLHNAWVTIVRGKKGSLLYYCSRRCRIKHRGKLAEKNVLFRPEEVVELESR